MPGAQASLLCQADLGTRLGLDRKARKRLAAALDSAAAAAAKAAAKAAAAAE